MAIHSTAYHELSLPEMLADPIVQTVMARDGVTMRDLEDLIGAMRDRTPGRQMDGHKTVSRESGAIAVQG